MPFTVAARVSPGIAIREFDLTTVIPAVSTTEVAVAAHLAWGPVEQRVLTDIADQFEANFWRPTANSAVDYLGCQEFHAYGTKLYTVRVVNQGSTEGDKARNAMGNAANNAITLIKNEDDYTHNYSSGISGVGHWVAKWPGELGNTLKVSVCPSSNAWESTLAGNVAVTSNSTALNGSGTAFITELTAGDIVILGPDREEVKVAAIANSTSATLQRRYQGNTVPLGQGGSTKRRWEFFNQFDQAPGTSDYTAKVAGANDELHVAVVDEDGQITGVVNAVVERFEKLSFASDCLEADGTNKYYKDYINQNSRWVWWAAHNTANGNAGKKAKGVTFGGQGRPHTQSMVLGRDGATPRDADYINGYNMFANPEDVDISIVMGLASNSTRARHIIQNIAEARLDCVAVVSPPRATVVNNSGYAGSEVDDVVAFRNTLPSTSYGVLDGNWKQVYDRWRDIYVYVPCNPDIAGLIVQTDLARDPWWSPAGYNRGNLKNVNKLAWNPRQTYRDQLFKAGVNPIVNFPGSGTILFGDKTLLNKPSDFDAINVRRLFIVLEKAIATAAKFSLFEFNDAFTRAQFRNMVEPFLRDVQGRRGLDSFRVVCDETNNTMEVIQRKEFIGTFLLKPALAIRNITLNFVAVRRSVSFEEIAGTQF